MFDERHVPCECSGCERGTTVTHEDIQDVSSYLATSTVAEAIEYVMTECCWWSIQSVRGGALRLH